MELVTTQRILEIDEILELIVRAGDCRLRSADDCVPLPFKADTLLRIVREVPEDRWQMALMEKELSEVSGAIGSVRWMDPPDGGDVSLAEQVRRMRAALEVAEAKLAPVLDELKTARSIIVDLEGWSPSTENVKAIDAAIVAAEAPKS